jgi:hypothetical protein
VQYMLMIFEDETVYADEKAWTDIIGQHIALAQQFHAEGVKFYGDGLMRSTTATTVRRVGGQVSLHDGPYAETREQLGGYYVVDVPDLDAALAWARRIPLAKDGAIEVRPVLAAPAEAQAVSGETVAA